MPDEPPVTSTTLSRSGWIKGNGPRLTGTERVGSLGMNGQTLSDSQALAAKIARLVVERGWNQEDFARIAGLNRQTVRMILHQNGDRRLRNATVGACAKALGLTVNDLRTVPLERLLPRMHAHRAATTDERQQRL